MINTDTHTTGWKAGSDEALIQSFEHDANAFIEIFLERELSPKQATFIEFCSTKRHVIAIWSRQTGKSTVIASYIVWRLLYGKGCTVKGEHMMEKIAILAPIKEQHINIYDKIRTLTDRSELVSSFIEKINSERIIMKNGNAAIFMSASPGSHIRGYTATCIVIDESQDVTDHKYSADILPFGATTNALIIEAGTPKTKNHFYKAINNKNVAVVRQMWFECPFLSKEYVMSQKLISPDALWRQEYLCEFIEEGVLAFPSALFEPEGKDGKLTGRWNIADYPIIEKVNELTKEKVAKVVEDVNDGATYTSGLDLGKTEDNTVYTVMRTDLRPIRMEVQITFELGTKYGDIAKMVGMFHKVYQPYEFNFDYTNEKSFVDLLLANDVPAVVTKSMVRGGIHYTSKNKAEMVNATKVLLENYQLQLPSCAENLLQEFLNQHYEVNESSGQYKYYHPSNEHDDHLWSLLMSLKNISLFTSDDITTWTNPWAKHDENIRGTTGDTVKERLQQHKSLRRTSRYLTANERRAGVSRMTNRC